MKAAAVTLATAASLAAAQKSVTLVTESSNEALAKKGLTSIHEGAGINGVFLSDTGVDYVLNSTDSTLSQSIQSGNGAIPMVLGQLGETLSAGVAGIPAKLEKNYVTVNGSSDVFYACKPLPSGDPYRYSQDRYGVAVIAKGGDVPSSCESIKITVQGAAAAGNGTAPAGNHTAPGGNKTVTSKTTKYTTIPCDTPTTLAYNGKTYTVTSATTLTVEDCGCTESPSPVGPSPAKPTKTGGQPAPVNGGAVEKIGTGAAVVAAAALLL